LTPLAGAAWGSGIFSGGWLAGVTAQTPAFRETIFGPIAAVVVRDDAEAAAVANDTEHGLAAAIQTGSRGRERTVAGHLMTGIVHVNDQALDSNAFAPFGGTGASGSGSRFGSQSSWDEFTQWPWPSLRGQVHGSHSDLGRCIADDVPEGCRRRR
jgi:benzaldehyde dehydrogenase (NAD)